MTSCMQCTEGETNLNWLEKARSFRKNTDWFFRFPVSFFFSFSLTWVGVSIVSLHALIIRFKSCYTMLSAASYIGKGSGKASIAFRRFASKAPRQLSHKHQRNIEDHNSHEKIMDQYYEKLIVLSKPKEGQRYAISCFSWFSLPVQRLMHRNLTCSHMLHSFP